MLQLGIEVCRGTHVASKHHFTNTFAFSDDLFKPTYFKHVISQCILAKSKAEIGVFAKDELSFQLCWS